MSTEWEQHTKRFTFWHTPTPLSGQFDLVFALDYNERMLHPDHVQNIWVVELTVAEIPH